MNIEYLKIAKGDLTTTCELNVQNWGTIKDYPITTHVRDSKGEEITRAVITMYVSERKIKYPESEVT